MSDPTVSVVMSVFNGQQFLAEAVESILKQSFRDFEFVIIDDGSTDETPKILNEYAGRDTRIRLVRQQNKGRAESLNIGIGLAKGKYIARMDADDISLPNRFQEQVEFLEQHPDVGLLGGTYQRIDRRGKILETVRGPLEDQEIKTRILEMNPMCHPAVMMRGDVALAAGGYRKALLDADDYDLWLRMSERTQLANLDGCILQYRFHSEQATIANSGHQSLCVLAARAATRFRRAGKSDPLSGVDSITPELVLSLGVTAAEMERARVAVYRYWMDDRVRDDPDVALRMIEGIIHSSGYPRVERRVIADLCLTAAGIQYKQGRPMKALLSVIRGVLVRPIIAARPVRNAFMRLAALIRA